MSELTCDTFDRQFEATGALGRVRQAVGCDLRLVQQPIADAANEFLRGGDRQLECGDGEHINRELLLRRERG
ncbi:MAG: hypothetical protein QOH16_647 [Gaiellaceae bacterium]|nr:hypothetical protein [Gaiellaceae bacterium]